MTDAESEFSRRTAEAVDRMNKAMNKAIATSEEDRRLLIIAQAVMAVDSGRRYTLEQVADALGVDLGQNRQNDQP